jgi:glycosyltransferase involved in cell wall biosynthesis
MDNGSGIRGLIYLTDAKSSEISPLCAEVNDICSAYASGIELDVRSFEDADIPDEGGMRKRYSVIEYCTAIKPSILISLSREFPRTTLHYFDPDIAALGDLKALRHFATQHSFTVLPHMTTPTEDAFHLSQLDVLRAGVYNFGYVGWNPEKGGQEMIRWWQRRLNKDSRIALAEGIFVDQSWGVLLSASPNAGVFRDLAYNVAYWNLHEREITWTESGHYLCNEAPLQFFHFSGFSPDKPDTLSLHQNRHWLPAKRGLKKLCNSYAAELFAAGFNEWRAKYSAHRKELVHSRHNPAFESNARLLVAKALGTPTRRLPQLVYRLANRIEWIGYLLTRRAILYLSLAKTESAKSTAGAALRKAVQRKMTGMVNHAPQFPEVYCYHILLRLLCLLGIMPKSNKPPQVGSTKTDGSNGGQTKPYGLANDFVGAEHPVAVIGYLTAETGVGESSRGVIRAIDTTNLNVKLYNIDRHYARAEDTEFAHRLEATPPDHPEFDACVVCVNADQVPIEIPQYPVSLLSKSRRRIGYWYWETEIFPASQTWIANYFDEIWVATQFVQGALIRSGLRVPVRVVPPSLGVLPSNHMTRKQLGLPEKRQVCLSVFDATSFLGRKNPMGVINALKLIYAAGQNKPLLVLKTTNMKDADSEKLLQMAKPVDVIIINKYLSRKETLSLIAASDCYISLHRAEGLGLSLIDAMRLSVPLVTTGYSGPCDFINEANAWIVPWKYCPALWEDGPYFGSSWAEPDLDGAAMRIAEALSSNKASEKTVIAKAQVEAYFSPERIGRIIAQALGEAKPLLTQKTL